MSGTVNISRSIWRDEAFKPEAFTEREAWMWMVMEASYKPRSKPVGDKWVQTERGQLACSVRFMCEAWGWSKSRVDRFLKRLENRDMIGTDAGTGLNVITICKYDEYQNKPNHSGTPETRNRDSSGTAAGQQRDKPNKGLIPDAIQEKETPKGVRPSFNAGQFQAFWDAFPHRNGAKKGRKDAETAWRKAIKGGADPIQIISAATRYQSDGSVNRGYGKGPIPWLNGECWNDDIEPMETRNDPRPNNAHQQQPRGSSPHSTLHAAFGSVGGYDDGGSAEPSGDMRDVTPTSAAGLDCGPGFNASEPFLRVIND